MPLEIKFMEYTAPLAPGETVLEALEKAGAPVSSSCRAGACQVCLMRALSGKIPRNSQEGLKESLRQTNHFLSCVCRPTENLTCEPASSAPFRGFVVIQEVRSIGPDVARIRFARPAGLEFNPGQFVTLKREDGVARSYSIASSQQESNYFDIHVRRIANGRLSAWFHDEAKVGDRLWLEGPKGDCRYYPGEPGEPLTLIGTGTGIAPLFAIALDALENGHTGEIAIYHGARSEDRFYLTDELSTLASLYRNVSYHPCVAQGAAEGNRRVGDLKEIVVSDLSDARLRRVYLCGDPGLVRTLKRQLFLAGISLSRIHADPFIGTGTTSAG